MRAEHLANARSPFALADILRAIATKIDCAGVVIDIRAGLVPLAAQIILDPGVSQIFVTTLAGQSLDGTVALIKYVSREARRRALCLGRPLLVVNRIPSVLRETGADKSLLAPALEKITFELARGREATATGDEAIFTTDEDIRSISVSKMPEISDLQATSANWDGFVEQVRNSGFLRRFSTSLAEWLQQTVLDLPVVQSNAATSAADPSGLAERDRRHAAEGICRQDGCCRGPHRSGQYATGHRPTSRASRTVYLPTSYRYRRRLQRNG